MKYPFPLSLVAAGALALLGACAGAPQQSVPDALRPGADETLALTYSARGVQIYECRAGANGAAPAWAFVAPEAELFDADGRRAGRHGAGPYWQALDGSRVQAAVKARADAPAGDAIPWLLLSARADGQPAGTLSRVSSIQRVNTSGGLAPAKACTAGSTGTTARVAYSADYHFFSTRTQ